MSRLLIVACIALTGCGDASCTEDVRQIARAPGSDRYAVTAVRDCGATTDFATIVRVGRASEPQSAAREIFVADSDHGKARGGSDGSIWTSVAWSGADRLVIAYAPGARIFKNLPTTNGVQIRYRASEPTSLPPVP